DARRGGRVAFHDVDFGAVARREQRDLAGAGDLRELLEHARRFVRRDGHFFAHVDRRGVVAQAGQDQRHAASSCENRPLSTASQKVSSTSDADALRHSSREPASSSRRLSRARADTAAAYRVSNRDAIASRTRAATPGTPPAVTATTRSPARRVASVMNVPAPGSSARFTNMPNVRAASATRTLTSARSVAATTRVVRPGTTLGDRSAGANGRASMVHRSLPNARTPAPGSTAMMRTRAPAFSSARAFRSATLPPPTITASTRAPSSAIGYALTGSVP